MRVPTSSAIGADFDQSQAEKLQAYVEKTLHEVCKLYELIGQRTARPYYPLNDGWGLSVRPKSS